MKYISKAVAAAVLTIGVAQGALGEERFPSLALDQMSPAQRKVAEAIISGPRGTLNPLVNAWLRSPVLADRFQQVGAYLRYDTSLPHRLNEFAILIAAREWTSQYEWYSHYPLAMAAGLKPELAAELALGKRPAGMQADEALVYDFSLQLHRNKANIPDALYKSALAQFGEQGVVDLISVAGYYDAAAMMLNAAQVGVPPGEKLPLAPLK